LLNNLIVPALLRKEQLFVAVSVSGRAAIDLHQGTGFANNYSQHMNSRILPGYGFDASERTADELTWP